MRKIAFTFAFSLICFSINAQDGLIRIESSLSVEKTADKAERILKSKSLIQFIRVNHKKNAEKVGLSLSPTELIIFGNPRIGTPLMQCAPNIAIDLPQKILIYEATNKKVWLSYNDPMYLKSRHNIKGCDDILSKMSNALAAISKAIVAK